MPCTPEASADCVPDPEFEPTELLYRRYAREHVDASGGVRPQSFRFPYLSVNRAKYSTPTHVIHRHCSDGKDRSSWGVHSLVVSDVTDTTYDLQNDRREFKFYLKHVPELLCKAHSEVHCREDPAGVDVEPPPSVRNRIRILLSQRAKYIIRPKED